MRGAFADDGSDLGGSLAIAIIIAVVASVLFVIAYGLRMALYGRGTQLSGRQPRISTNLVERRRHMPTGRTDSESSIGRRGLAAMCFRAPRHLCGLS